jgi:hypothetical protein
MKGVFVLLFIIILPLTLFCQTQGNEFRFVKRLQVSIKSGIIYQDYFGSRYIKLNAYPQGNKYYKLNGFTKKPSLGFQSGLLVKFKFAHHFFISTGVLYVLREDIYQGDYDYISIHGSPMSGHKIVKYEYSYNTMEVPLYFGYYINKLNFSIGASYPFLIHSTAKYTYIPDPYLTATERTITGYVEPSRIYPILTASYDFPVGRFLVSPNIEFKFGEMKSYYFQLGVIFSMNL